MKRLKNGLLLVILISFLCFVAIMPVTCIFKSVTGIYCPACGMTRSFLSVLQFDFLNACFYNILSIPLFIFIIFSIFMIIIDFIKNDFTYIIKVLKFFERNTVLILFLLFVSFVFNNFKTW